MANIAENLMPEQNTLHPGSENADDEPDVDLEMELDDTTVQVIDGVLIKGDQEEVRLLFYHHKPGSATNDDDTIRCKGLVEFRTSRRTFNMIVKNIDAYAQSANTIHCNLNDRTSQEKLPMFA